MEKEKQWIKIEKVKKLIKSKLDYYQNLFDARQGERIRLGLRNLTEEDNFETYDVYKALTSLLDDLESLYETMNDYNLKKILKSFKHFLCWLGFFIIVGCVFGLLLPNSSGFTGSFKDWFWWIISWIVVFISLLAISESSRNDF